MQEKVKLVFSMITVLIGVSACWSDEGAVHHLGHQTINEQLKARSIDSIQYNVSTEAYLRSLEKVKVDLPGEEVHIPKRTSQMSSFPCHSCHSKPLNQLSYISDDDVKKAHWNIKLNHAEAGVMNCLTCHDDNNLEQLRSITGKTINLNHSYKLCSQCHSTQYKEWQGGAHGKRLGGWAPPKVINSCVNCHNPHSPSFEPRWPARLNTVKLIEQATD